MNEVNALLKFLFFSIRPRGTSKKVYGPKEKGPVIGVTPGRRHAWIQSRFGLIRKPITEL